MVALYVVRMRVVGSHLWHGISSAFHSLGADKPAWTRFMLPAGKVVAVLMAAAFISIALWAHFAAAPFTVSRILLSSEPVAPGGPQLQ